MGLSNKLVSQFVKATKSDTTNNKKEKTVYGNIVKKDNSYFAIIDGADKDTLIPITQFASNINQDDKVIIMIKDHVAIVTGNLKDPSINDTQIDNKIDEKLSDLQTISLDEIDALWE